MKLNRRTLVPYLVILAPPCGASGPEWLSDCRYRVLLNVDMKGRARSHSPATVEIDWHKLAGSGQLLDDKTIQVVAHSTDGRPRDFDKTMAGNARFRVPHRLERFFGARKAVLHFVITDHHCTTIAVYGDTADSSAERPPRYHGLVGDGDRFSEGFKRREIAASHFDHFADIDGDGDLDLCKGGVEPYVYCYENTGGNRMIDRGRLASGGELFVLPKSRSNRSWVTVAFHDIDDDGDQDFCPSFGDGPDAGQIVLYRNTTREHGGALTFMRAGPLRTTTGVPLAGGAQSGGWFPSVCFVKGWDGSSHLSALVGSNHRCWLYRGAGRGADGVPRFADAVAVQAGGVDIVLTNPRFDAADLDGDGDLDLLAGTQPGPIHVFPNTGTRDHPVFAAGEIQAFGGKYLIGDAHSGVKAVDLDHDGAMDFVAGRFWERTDLRDLNQPRDYGGLFRNTGTTASPRFEKTLDQSPFTEQFQPCDAIRQNSVRAVDWDDDGKTDLLAGDTDGFIWLFRHESGGRSPIFATGVRLLADGKALDVSGNGGHARFDHCDWNNDGARDLLVAGGHGTLTLFLNRAGGRIPDLAAGVILHAGDKPIHAGARASVLVCDWDRDSRKDVVLADDEGYYFCRNTGTDARPLLAAPTPVTGGGKPVSYVRPNHGSFVDWDGDGTRDLVAGHFENSIRFHRNTGAAAPGAEPQFDDPEGTIILQASSPQMISGVEAVDWNGDGDLDILTGQGHGGSGLRYYERDWIEDALHGTHPVVSIGEFQTKDAAEARVDDQQEK